MNGWLALRLMPPGPDAAAWRPALDALHEARERTVAAGSACVELWTEHTWQLPPVPQRRRGGLARPFLEVAKFAGKRAWRLVTRSFNWRHLRAVGVVDFAGRRFMLDYGSYARLYAEGQEWDGRSGRPIASLPPSGGDKLPTPLWLLDLLTGATAAEDAGIDDVRGAPCRQVRVKVDLTRASKATPGDVAVPSVGRFEELLALPVDVWLDAAHVRRVRFVTDTHTDTLELWEFGVGLDGLDWTPLPTFRSPDEAATVATHSGTS